MKIVAGRQADTLSLYMMGHSAFQYLYAGLELGLFDFLADRPGSTREVIAEKLALAYLPSRCLLFGLTALGLIEKTLDAYSNSGLMETLRAKGKLDLLLKVARFQAKIVYPGEMDFLESLRSNRNIGLQRIPGLGKDLYLRLTEDPLLQRVFFEFMSAWSAESLPLLLDEVDFGDRTMVGDVGGGDATVAVALAERYPGLQVRILDIPDVSPLAQRRISDRGLADRVRHVSRDVFTEDFPSGCDCFLFVHFLVIWSPEENLYLLQKAYESLPKGGKVVIFSSMASDSEDGPLFAALDTAYFMAVPTPGGLIYSYKDYEEWLRTVGFEEVLHHPCSSWWTPHGAVIASKR